MRSFKLSPSVESMEGRCLLSGAVAAGGHVAAAMAPSVHLALNGSVTGPSAVIPQAGITNIPLSGAGNFGSLGTMTATGSIHITTNPSINSGGSGGSLILSNSQGTITIQLTALSTPSTGPKTFSFKIVGSTGAFAGVQDQGTATLNQIMAPASTSGAGVRMGGAIFALNLASS